MYKLGHVTHVVKDHVSKVKYTGQSVPYYTNSVATFQILLLISGDVSPNPGPATHSGSDYFVNHNPNDKLTYNSQSLHSLNSTTATEKCRDRNSLTWNKIVSLGINRKRKTHRGKRGGLRFSKVLYAWSMLVLTIFQDFVTDHHLDIVCICETWLSSDDDAIIDDLCPAGFTFKHHTRAGRRGGGVAFLFRDTLTMTINVSDHYASFEVMTGVITHHGRSLELVLIYRPPGYNSFSQFLDDFSNLLEVRLWKPSPSSLLVTSTFTWTILHLHILKIQWCVR